MIRATGSYQKQALYLDAPVELEEGARVVIDILPADASDFATDWAEIGMERLEAEWDNSDDSIYDNWRTLYGVPAR